MYVSLDVDFLIPFYFTEVDRWFNDSALSWGYPRFMLVSELNDPEKGFLLNGSLIVEAEILLMGMLKNFIRYFYVLII
ncbi:hypothetical protein OSB04_016006 [Centaurea solstitialis]|uniref:MATH domain-containing protein n=1 Tax=Centaurea solstitialis TaxID=347529 RepID=A0AA38WKM9_9ASTR|nr:hypothetical protein OSB04_016006 [Centaurea solstitialis]